MEHENVSIVNSDYRFALDHVEKLLDRRQSTTSFYISINVGIAARHRIAAQRFTIDAGLALDIRLPTAPHRFHCLSNLALSAPTVFKLARLVVCAASGFGGQDSRLSPSHLVTSEYQKFYRDEKTQSWLQKVFKAIGMTEHEQLLVGAITALYLIFAIGALVTALL